MILPSCCDPRSISIYGRVGNDSTPQLLGAIHKLCRQIFEIFCIPHPPYIVYYRSLFCWHLANSLPVPYACQRSLWTTPKKNYSLGPSRPEILRGMSHVVLMFFTQLTLDFNFYLSFRKNFKTGIYHLCLLILCFVSAFVRNRYTYKNTLISNQWTHQSQLCPSYLTVVWVGSGYVHTDVQISLNTL